MSNADQQTKRPNLLQVFLSVVAALFGVQTEQARVRDFSQKSPLPYIAVGIVLIVLFVLGIALLVRTVLKLSGAL
ncbi:DUF2970 domain-containing protein [Aliidiomarina sp. Khilg15.8]